MALHSDMLLSSTMIKEQVEVISIEEAEAEQLAGYGVYPGVVLTIQQRFPSFVVKTDETELAIEHEVAQKITVRRVI